MYGCERIVFFLWIIDNSFANIQHLLPYLFILSNCCYFSATVFKFLWVCMNLIWTFPTTKKHSDINVELTITRNEIAMGLNMSYRIELNFGQPTAPTGSDCRLILKFWDGRTDISLHVKLVITIGRDCGSASWIKKSSEYKVHVRYTNAFGFPNGRNHKWT